MRIRRAQTKDLTGIAAVQTESWRDAYSEVLPETYLAGRIARDLEHHWKRIEIQPEDVVLVAEDETISGFIAIWCRPDPFIDNLHVIPPQRSKQIGTTLLISAARLLIQQGHKTACLWVVESNIRAIRLYERLGGISTGRAMKNLFGHQVPNVRIEFCDLHSMLRPAN